jgi:hypothetical protein
MRMQFRQKNELCKAHGRLAPNLTKNYTFINV